MKQKHSFSTQQLVMIALMAALVFLFSKFRIDIPSPLGKTGIHFGNIMCLLGGMLFGALPGGFAAGIGSALLDLTDPVYAPEFWITFLTKFALGYVAGLLGQQAAAQGKRMQIWIAGACGSLTYVFLYTIKNIVMGHFVKGFVWQAAISETLVLKLPVSLVNGILATVCAAVLVQLLSPSLRRARLLDS